MIKETDLTEEQEKKPMQFDIYTLIFAGLAVFVIIKLRSVLGTRTGEEKPPHDPYRPREPVDAKSSGNNDNVIPLPRPADRPADAPAIWRWEGMAIEGTPLANGFDAIARLDKNFDPAHFRDGAKAAYEMIVTCFARADRKSLKDLLSREVFDAFNSVMNGREQRGETAEVTFVSIDKVDLVQAEARGNSMQLGVRFHSKMISVTRDKSGHVVDGSPETVADVTDVWTFAREAGARDPNWKLVTTEAGH